ncbi:MAG: glycoside hydrolase family 25 protein [Clostridia bacterium]
MINFFRAILRFFLKIPVIISLIFLTILLAFLAFVFLFNDSSSAPKTNVNFDLPEINFAVVDDIRSGKFVIIKQDYPENEIDIEEFSVSDTGIINYSGESYLGIDISTYQEDIDWEKIKNAGVDFVILRIGYRGAVVPNILLDGMFLEHINSAIEYDIDIGVYFFSQAINAEEGIEEAEFVIEQLEPYKDSITYPVVFDWEWVYFEDNRTDAVSGQETSNAALGFCETIENAGYIPMVYVNKSMGYDHYDLETINDYPLWLAEYEDAPSFFYEFDMWQYSESGTIDGIDGNVDLNISFTDFGTSP